MVAITLLTEKDGSLTDRTKTKRQKTDVLSHDPHTTIILSLENVGGEEAHTPISLNVT